MGGGGWCIDDFRDRSSTVSIIIIIIIIIKILIMIISLQYANNSSMCLIINYKWSVISLAQELLQKK